ncbi:MAG: hypothetical protein JWM16_4185 [Verrucomicrobiales bacterium]|nr:hypothetical protein [Verrucomicrobiales bacterium]
MMLLAEFSPPMDIAAWMGCLAFGVHLWNQVHKALDRNKEQPAPAQTYATKADLVRVESELKTGLKDAESQLRVGLKDVEHDLRGLKDQIVNNGEVRRKSIEGKVETVKDELHDKFTILSVEIAEIKTSQADQSTHIQNLTAELKLRGLTAGPPKGH